LAETERLGRHRHGQPESPGRPGRRSGWRLVAVITAVCVAVAAAFGVYDVWFSGPSGGTGSDTLPAKAASYIGFYSHGVPDSFTGIEAFTASTGIRPGILVYYSGWMEPFQVSFARRAASQGAVPLVQINPTGIDLTKIANGHYDSYLTTYAQTVRSYRHPVIISFGHEMNGSWYSWGYTHTSPATFVAAWRHIVTLFRTLGAGNVTWMWTVNTTTQGQPGAGTGQAQTAVPSPSPWWPGDSYVTWVGIDGYYTSPSSMFAAIFGPTITQVRTLTRKPVIIAETAATAATGQPEKISDVFAGIHLYGLLGFIWFNSVHDLDWRVQGTASAAAFRRGAGTFNLVNP
jgi:mannan endo-1,4-beta-mannosidase